MENSIAWLLTYLLHSTIILFAVWLITNNIRILSEPFKERLWKFAIIGGVVSATLQISLGVDPFCGKLIIEKDDPLESVEEHLAKDKPVNLRTASKESSNEKIHEIGSNSIGRTSSPGSDNVAMANFKSKGTEETSIGYVKGSSPRAIPKNLPVVALGICILSAAVVLIWLGLSWIRLRFLLSDRREIVDGSMPTMLNKLRMKAGFHRPVRLTWSPNAASPMAFGIGAPEICMPQRAVYNLSRSEQESMLAHELAHLVRHDPLWLTLFRITESIFFFQPLNRLASAKWLELSEYCCDSWAIRKLGGGINLAKCLTEVAGWMLKGNDNLNKAAASTMTRNRSNLSKRIKRILDGSNHGRGNTNILLLSLIISGTLLLITNAAPGFSAQAQSNPPAHKTPSVSVDIEDFQDPEIALLIEELQALDLEIKSLEVEVRSVKKILQENNLDESVGPLLIQAEKQLQLLNKKSNLLKDMISLPEPE